MSEKLVKVKILKNIGPYMAGQEVEVLESQSNVLCTPRKHHNGHEVVETINAMPLARYETLKNTPPDMGGLTVSDCNALGIKNIVKTPEEEITRPFHPGFVEIKDPAETHSAKMTQELNNSRKRHAS